MSSDVHYSRLPSLHTRIRRRRAQLGLTGGELAQRAGISTSYVSLIERGAKVPEEEVAAGLARALGDDEALYRGWARAARLGVHDLALLNELELIARTPAYASLVESGQELPRLDPPPTVPKAPASALEGDVEAELGARLREVASRIAPSPSPDRAAASAVVAVPVLAEGEDPSSPSSGADRLLLDRRLLGPHDPRQLFAREVTAGGAKRLRGVAAAGDRIVFLRGGEVAPDRICAVRTRVGLVLSRVLVKDGLLLLLPGEGESDFDSIAVPDAGALSRAVAGTHVLVLRR